MGLLVLLCIPLDRSVVLDIVEELVERPALPAAARHINRTKVRISVKPKDSRPAARLQLDPLSKMEKNPALVCWFSSFKCNNT